MTGLIGGIGGLVGALGGNAAKTDRKYQLAGYGDPSNVFNFGMNQGGAGYKEGAGTERQALGQLAAPASYYQRLLTGNRPAVMQAVSPTVNVANAQADAARRGIAASGTARGGGVNAGEQQADTAKQSAIDTAINQVRPEAAEGATRVAGQVGQIGGTQLSSALRLLGLGEEAATNLTGIASQSRETSQALHNQKVQSISEALASVFAGGLGFLPKSPPASVPYGQNGPPIGGGGIGV